MLIGDLLNVAGGLQLKQFDWGSALVEVLNAELKEHVADTSKLLTPESTGEQARAFLFNLPAHEMAAFVVKDFDPGSRTLHDAPAAPAAGHAPAPVVNVPLPSPHPTPAPKPAPKLTNPVGMIASLPEKARKNMALIMGGTLVVVTLLIAVAMSATTVKTGEMPDAGALNTVIQILGEVVKAYMKAPAPPTGASVVF